MRLIKQLFLAIVFLCGTITLLKAEQTYDIVVAKDGSGDFSTLTEAISTLPMYNYDRTVIFIKNGVYNEKVKIECDYVTLLGEDKDSTIIAFDIPREEWLKNPDNIGPAVVNIYADDIILKNVTIENTQPRIGPHAFAIYGTGTRTILYNCNAKSKGGDTVSLWNYKHGMYYHANCYFEGSVDFVCPRGWCYIRNSRFYEYKQTAAIWHAAVTDSSQKFVLENCYFDGVKGFQLGRHHYEAQFYLMNCTFSENMADKPLFHVTYPDRPEKNRPYFFGNRYYYTNATKQGAQFNWLKDTLPVAKDKVTAAWTFNHAWNPEDSTMLIPTRIELTEPTTLFLYFSELVGVRGKVTLKTQKGKTVFLKQGTGRDRLEFYTDEELTPDDLDGLQVVSGEVYAIKAYLKNRTLSFEN